MCFKLNYVLVFLFVGIISITNSENAPHNRRLKSHPGRVKSHPVIDTLISSLNNDEWHGDEEACLRRTLEMLYGVKNGSLWATWFWDSMQPPTGVFHGTSYHLGNFDQCMTPPASWADQGLAFQYCLVDVNIGAAMPNRDFGANDDAGVFLKTTSNYGRENNKLTFGVCLPTSCSSASIPKVYRHIHQLSYLPDGVITVDPKECQDPRKPEFENPSRRVFWSCIKILLALAIISTCYNSLFNKRNTTLDSITKPFCLRSNYKDLFKSSDEDIRAMHGIRFLTAFSIVAIHEILVITCVPLINNFDMDKRLNQDIIKLIYHSDVVVDTFFALSGLLLVKGLVSRKRNLFFVLLKRYLRLLGPYAVVILFMTYELPYMGSGPVYSRIVHLEDEGICQKYWWKNLLMLNNNIENLCYAVSWCVPTDFRLSVLGTFIFYIYQRNKKFGVISFVTIAVTMLLKLGYVVYANNLDFVPLKSFILFIKIRHIPYINETYFNFDSRVGPYFAGMVMGYIMAIYKPRDHRNVISKKYSLIGLIISLTVGLYVSGLYYFYANKQYVRLEVATIAALNRTLWAMAVCLIIGVCEYGTIPNLTNFLGHPFFTPLSKLSYCVYLTHIIVNMYRMCSTRSLMTHTFPNILINTFGDTLMACIISLVLYLLIEAPLVNISNRMFTDKKPVRSEKETSTNGLVYNGKIKSKTY